MDPNQISYPNLIKDYCSDLVSTTENPVLYRIGHAMGNTLMLLGIDQKTKKIYKYSNEWLFLLKDYYNTGLRVQNSDHKGVYFEIISYYLRLCNKNSYVNTSHANKDVISLVTSFSRGTVHGYAGIFCILEKYIKQKDKFKNHYFLVWKGCQRGIMEIIKEFIVKEVIRPGNVLYVNDNITYQFKSMEFIHNDWHMYPSCIVGHEDFKLDIIKDYLIDPIKYRLDPKANTEKVCIIKSSGSTNLTSSGIVSEHQIKSFCKKHNLYWIEPGSTHELYVINALYNCKVFVTSWGTAFFKNNVYLSDKCTDIYVLIIGSAFKGQFNSGNNKPTRCKNAKIHYILCNNNEITMPMQMV